MKPVIRIVGKSGSGKTAFITTLIKEFRSRGLKVASAKHTLHPVELDTPGKDTWKHKEAGAEPVILFSGRRYFIMGKMEDDWTPDDILNCCPGDFDIILMEGDHAGSGLKIEVVCDEDGKLKCGPEELTAVISGRDPGIGVPCFAPGAVSRAADMILEKLSRNKE